MRVIWLPLLSAPLLAVGLGCSKATSKGDGSSAAGSAGASPSALARPQRVAESEPSSASAFELVARSGGLRLLWAGAPREPDWLFELELGQDGRAHAAARRLPLPARSLGKVVDLGAVAFGEQLALVWLEQAASEARAQACVLGGATPPPLLDLGPAALVSDAARGNIAVAAEAERGRALVMWRGLEATCVDRQSAPCTGFTFRRIRPDGAEATRLPLSVPVPCTSHSVELATSNGRFHYGVCTREGSEPVTTMFSIQYDPEYARAEPLLKGCLPLGTLEVGGEPWLLGDCHGRRRAARVPVGDEKVQLEDLDAPAITCTPQRAELRQGRFVLQLREARAGLQAVLPASFVPTGARAGWTGTHLVVAYIANKQLETRTFSCREGKLQPN